MVPNQQVPSTQPGFKLGCFNIGGGFVQKLEALHTHFVKHEYDFLIIQETWLMEPSKSSFDTSILVHAISRELTQHQRGKWGQTILVRPALKKYCTIMHISRDSLDVTVAVHIPGREPFSFMAIYNPPHNSVENFLLALNRGRNVDVIMGDLNIRFGGQFGDAIITPKNKIVQCRELCRAHGFRHLYPDGGHNLKFTSWNKRGNGFIDHCFAKSPAAQMRIIDGRTIVAHKHQGHHLIEVFTEGRQRETMHRRYKWGCLKNDQVIENINSSIIKQYTYFSALVTKMSRDISTSTSPAAKKQVIEIIWEIIEGIYLNTITEFIPIYIPKLHLGPQVPVKKKPKDHLDHEKVNMVLRHLKNRYQYGARAKLGEIQSPDEFQSQMKEKYEKIYDSAGDKLSSFPPRYISAHIEGANPFNMMNLVKQIDNYPKRKAAGFDQIPMEFYQSIGYDALKPLLFLFRSCFLLGVTPESWNFAEVSLIPKPGVTMAKDMRPISLTLVVRRIFERCTLQSMQEGDLNRFLDIHFTQTGFKQKCSCYPNIVQLHNRLSNGKSYTAFLDIKAAYDTVNIPVLLAKLERRGVPARWINIFLSLFQYGISAFKSPDGSTCKILRTRGLMQGSILSPWMWNLYSDDLSHKLAATCSSNEEFGGLSFADDLVIVADSAAMLQKRLDICAEWARDNQMEWGIAKCGTLSHNNMVFHLDGQQLPNVSSYKYLGVFFNVNGIHFAESRRKLVEIFSSALKSAVTLGFAGTEVVSAHWLKLTWFKAFIRSKIEYELPVMSLAPANEQKVLHQQLDVVLEEGLQKVVGQYGAKLKTLCELTGVLSMADRKSQLWYSVMVHLIDVKHLFPEDNYLHTLPTLLESHPIKVWLDRNGRSSTSYFKDRNLLAWRKEKLALIDAPTPQRRHPRSGWHLSLALPQSLKHIRSAIYRWRLNLTLPFRCLRCRLHHCSRSHIGQCILDHGDHLPLIEMGISNPSNNMNWMDRLLQWDQDFLFFELFDRYVGGFGQGNLFNN
jgi:hypothetical protein